MTRKIKRVLDGSEQGLDIVVISVLFQEGLPSIRIWHERLVQENNRNGRASGIAKSNPCTIFASGKS